VRHLGTLMLLVIVMVVVAAFGASAAWAGERLPAWGQCVHTESGTGGRYADPGCVQPVRKVYGSYTGAYEWYPMEVSPGPGDGEAILRDRLPPEQQPAPSTTITLADGYTITCQALMGRRSTGLFITGPLVTLSAPIVAFDGCRATFPEEGSECFTSDFEEEGEITTLQENYNYYYGEGPTWHGKLTYFEGRRTAEPVVGYVWETSPAKERFLQQLDCEGGPVQTLEVGGHKRGEELAMQVTPLNTMSEFHTLKMSQSGGVGLPASFEGHGAKPMEAQVNGTTWEPIGFETTMLFPETEAVYPEAEPRGVRVSNEMELKATP
jgi:hypothetical protein